MEDIDARLRQTADDCIKAYDAWSKSKKNAEARSALQETLHELRKVSARLEIEMASSERDEMTQRQIPIPSHRSSRPRGGHSGADMPDFIAEPSGNDDDSIGNSVEGSEGPAQSPNQNRPQRSGGSGGQNRMQHRRPMRPRPQEGGND